ncbi:MAG: heparinase II/III family protein [Caulobacteraceae bacterium]
MTVTERRTLPPALQGGLNGRFDLAENPFVLMTTAVAVQARRQLADEWRRTGLYRMLLGRPAAQGLAAAPRDQRPVEAKIGREVLLGRFAFEGEEMEVGQDGDPWDRPSPSRRFATHLHRFGWLPDLMVAGDGGAREALRLFLLWRELFGRPASFAWGAEIVERRVFNLACAGRRLTQGASDAETTGFANLLAAQARHLLHLDPGPARAAERALAAAVAGTALAADAGERLMEMALPRLAHALGVAVLPDGGVSSRSPEAALELLLDLLTLDDGLQQRGREAPAEVSRAIDRLMGAQRFFTLGDGRLACFHGGRESDQARIAAALAHDDGEGRPFGYAPHSGYHRMVGQALQVIVDCAPPPPGPWSVEACGQPLAMEVTAGPDRLFTNADCDPDSGLPNRRTEAACTLGLGGGSAGEPLTGFIAGALGARLIHPAKRVDARRNETANGVWLDLAHDGWVKAFGFVHERRLFLDLRADELRGEERLAPASDGQPRRTEFTVRFHLHPDVQVSLARDNHSALLRGPSNRGWRFRSDAASTTLEPSIHFEDGRPRRSTQIVLRGETDVDTGAQVRWKLAPVESAEPRGASSTRKQTPSSPPSDAQT